MIYEWDMRNAVHQYATECREKRATHLQSVHCAQLLQHSYSPVPSVHTRSIVIYRLVRVTDVHEWATAVPS